MEHTQELRKALEQEYEVVWGDELPEHRLRNATGH